MSKRTSATSAARGAAKAAGGAHLTRQARMGTLARLMHFLHDSGFQVADVAYLRERHIAAYIQARRQAGVRPRTLQNEAAHIRGAMRAEGRAQAADSPTITNEALGISGGSRAGTKVAATEDQYQTALAVASELDRGLAAVLMLERTLGLRSAEAVQAGPSLATWERQLRTGERVTVIFGTKGGRPRESMPAERDAAIEAVVEARAVASSRGGRLLDANTLKKAMTWYRNQMHRRVTPAAGVAGHALRYAYACDRISGYEAGGLTEAEALALASIDLGHGDGRGRYVKHVYARTMHDRAFLQGAGPEECNGRPPT